MPNAHQLPPRSILPGGWADVAPQRNVRLDRPLALVLLVAALVTAVFVGPSMRVASFDGDPVGTAGELG